MSKKLLGKIKFLITIAIICSFVWFLVISPMLTFKKYETTFKEAAERYFELNSNQLPTGERVKTLSLNALFKESYLKEDFYVPYSKNPCSLEKSWVKVRRNNGEYEYIVYLECGTIKSNVDHEGPEIKLKGDSKITVNLDEEFKDPGVDTVIDAVDGKINLDTVVVKGKVDTSKIDTYDIKYIAYDSLNNKTTVTRTVEVVKSLKSVVKKTLGDANNFKGDPLNNYVRLSNMYFRIYGLTEDGNDVILVSDEDIANVSHHKIDKWLEYYYDHLNDFTKDNIVESKFCNMNVDDSNINSTECSGFTEKKKVYIPSFADVNKAQDGVKNFMKPFTISWIANKKDDDTAYTTRNIFYEEAAGYSFYPFDKYHNYGVKPMFVFNGDVLIKRGDGTVENPYEFGDTKKIKYGEKLSERETGEYVYISGILYRIIEVNDDGTTKVTSMNSLGVNNYDDVEVYSVPDEDNLVYNPKNRKSVAYFINNGATEYIDTRYFVNHEIEVPIYKDRIVYGEEVEKKKYTVKLAAPDMFEMYSAMGVNYDYLYDFYSYWLINGSKTNRMGGAITDIGVPINELIGAYWRFGIRVTGHINKDMVIVSGKGTYFSPFKIN